MAEEQNNLTFWQRLNKVINSDTYDTNQVFQEVPKELIVTHSKEEMDVKKLELQQGKYLKDQYKKVTDNLYQQSVYYETTRLGTYMDVEAMEFYPAIAAALDIFSEESCVTNNVGKILNIHSDSDRVKKILENLFNDVLDISTNLPAWTRNTCKYGDNFVYLKTDKKKGVVNAIQLPNLEITRKEGDFMKSDEEDNADKNVRFMWANRNVEFNSFQIAHFRLAGDDRRLPYGTSILEKARKIWKQLVLLEDSAAIYRISRAPERRVFKIDVGNIDDKDVDAYVQRVAQKFKRTPQVNNNGQQDMRYHQMSVETDYFIPTRNGNNQTVIDTLPGASNLDAIDDLKYFQNNLLTSLRIPKAFLGFEEAAGEGKNLAMQDVRFARTINRIQQCMIQELNKIAIIHLYMLGFDEDLNNFTLSLSNPSTQAEMLKVEQWTAKVDLYQKAVADAGNGFGAMSMTKAKKEILGMSDDEIILDIKQQRVERMASIENKEENVAGKLTSGVFKDLDARYSIGAKPMEAGAEGGGPDAGGPSGGGGMGSSPEVNLSGDEGLPPGEENATEVPAIEPGAEAPPTPEPVAENKYSIEGGDSMLLSENINKLTKDIDKLLKG